MEIGLTYSSKDPKQIRTRDFVVDFVRERGILANITEQDSLVDAPRITINGCCVSAKVRAADPPDNSVKFPSMKEIARALEQSSWGV